MPSLADLRQKEMYQNLFLKRKSLNLTSFDIALFGYLAFISRTQIIISITTAQLADALNEPYNKVSASVKKYIDLDLIRRIKYKKHSGFMICPLMSNSGSYKIKAFRVKLWSGEINVHPPKKNSHDRTYPIQRKNRKENTSQSH